MNILLSIVTIIVVFFMVAFSYGVWKGRKLLVEDAKTKAKIEAMKRENARNRERDNEGEV